MTRRISKRMLIAVALAACGAAPAPGGTNGDGSLRLVVNLHQQAVNLDDCVEFSLKLVGDAVEDAVASWRTDGTVASLTSLRSSSGLSSPASFESGTYRFAPSELGTTTVGPFTLRVGDQELRSDTVELLVAPAPEHGETIRLIPRRTHVRVGEPFVLTVVGFSGRNLQDERWMTKPVLQNDMIGSVSPFSSSYALNGYGCVEGYTYKYVFAYRITAVRSGVMTLGAESFDSLPEDATVQRVDLVVVD